MNITEEISRYISEHKQEAYELLTALARIPAPSGREERRAGFIMDWLKEKGAKNIRFMCIIPAPEGVKVLV